jgi:hypothetical protein
MPNKRKDGKQNTNVWLTEAEREVLLSIRKELGLNSNTEVIKRAIEELAKKKGIIKNEP